MLKWFKKAKYCEELKSRLDEMDAKAEEADKKAKKEAFKDRIAQGHSFMLTVYPNEESLAKFEWKMYACLKAGYVVETKYSSPQYSSPLFVPCMLYYKDKGYSLWLTKKAVEVKKTVKKHKTKKKGK